MEDWVDLAQVLLRLAELALRVREARRKRPRDPDGS